MSDVIEQSVTANSLDWHYARVNPANESDKPPVVCLHGIPAQSYTWNAILPDLADAGFSAIAPDWIGYGRSSKPEKRQFAYTPDAYVSELGNFLDSLDIQTCSLVVQGFLASAGIQFAFKNRDRVHRLAICNTPISTAAKLPWRIKQLGLPLAGDMATQDPLLMDRTLEKGSGFVVSDEDLDIYRRPFLKSSSAGRSLLYSIRNLQLKSAMAEIESGWKDWDKPTLLVWGTQDSWLPVTEARSLCEKLSECELVELPEAAHFPQEHFSKEIAQHLIRFLRRR